MQQYQKDRAEPAGREQAAAAPRAEDAVLTSASIRRKGYPHEGYLDFADNKVIEGTGTIQVRGVAENKERVFVPGSRVRVRFPVSDKYPATLVPDTAVHYRPGPEVPARGWRRTMSSSGGTSTPGRLLDDGMRVILQPRAEGRTRGSLSKGMERARLKYPVEPVPEASAGCDRPPSDRFSTQCLSVRSNAIQRPASGPLSCSRFLH